MSFSTFEVPIRKLIKLILILGGTGFTLGVIMSTVIAWQVGMLQPDAFAILGAAVWIFHAVHPALFAIYAIFGSGAIALLWLDRRSQKQERIKRWRTQQDLLLHGEVN